MLLSCPQAQSENSIARASRSDRTFFINNTSFLFCCPVIGQHFSSHSLLCFLSYVKTKKEAFSVARIIDGKDMNMIGNRVRELRIEKGLSQQALSNRLETLAIYVCRGSISRIEDKQRTVTDIELYGLAKILDIPIESLFEKIED